MTFSEYKEIIDKWTQLVNDTGISLSNGKPVPVTFFKTFLGLKRKVHQDMYNGVHNVKSKTVPLYVVKSIQFAKLLKEEVFLDQVRRDIPIFESDKTS